jgi:hypothetical protein
MTLPLGKLKFGNIDARYEVITRDPLTLEHFRESFVSPSGITIEEFLRGKRFFIYGMKGAGKTAFLRYLRLLVEEDHCLTNFTSFSTQISQTKSGRGYFKILASISLSSRRSKNHRVLSRCGFFLFFDKSQI